MSRESVVVVGSGAGGSVVAAVLARAGHPVLILEKGRDLRGRFGNDETKANRFFENQDPVLEPRTKRTQEEANSGVARSFVGDVNTLPTTVGGGTVHWDAKTPRFWRQDFKGHSTHGPIDGANIADWPLTYDELAPYYDAVERRIGVQGDRARMPQRTLAQAPRRHAFPMRPNPPMHAGELLAAGARKLGYEPYPFPMAVNSRRYDGRPACNSCGYCSGFGCPIHARGGAEVWLADALAHGARLKPRAFVTRIDTTRDGRRARGVTYRDARGRTHTLRADNVVLAASAIETARLLLLSRTSKHPTGLANRSGQVGRNLMFHYFTLGIGMFNESIHAWRGPSTTVTLDDFVGPFTGADAKAAGLPYFKGGICEVGAGVLLQQEAQIYAGLPNGWQTLVPLLKDFRLRDHLAAIQLVGEDLPQEANRVDLDPRIKDVHGRPVPRITHTPHEHELAASRSFAPKLAAICQAAPGAQPSLISAVPLVPGGPASDLEGPNSTAHIMGTARMGTNPRRSVVDPHGRLHEVENVLVADGSVFTSSGGGNPTLTIMALALRAATLFTGHRLQ